MLGEKVRRVCVAFLPLLLFFVLFCVVCVFVLAGKVFADVLCVNL